MPGPDSIGVVSTRLLTKQLERHLRGFTPDVRGRFLAELERTTSVSAACAACRLHEPMVRLHKKHDSRFAQEWEAALDRGFDPRLMGTRA